MKQRGQHSSSGEQLCVTWITGAAVQHCWQRKRTTTEATKATTDDGIMTGTPRLADAAQPENFCLPC
jgi:hypothetical protein